MINYYEYRFNFIIHTLEKLIDSYYSKGYAKEVRMISDIYDKITKKDHVKTTYIHNGFHSNLALTKPESV